MPSWFLFALWKKLYQLDHRANWIKEGTGGTTEGAHQERFFFFSGWLLMPFFTCLCTIQLVFLASQFVVDQQPICWAGQPTETSTQFFIKPQNQRSTMFVLRLITLRQGLSRGGGRQSKKIKKSWCAITTLTKQVQFFSGRRCAVDTHTSQIPQ